MVHGLPGFMPLTDAFAQALDGDRPFYVLVGRGLDGAESPHQRMEEMLDSYLAEIRAVRPNGPYIVGGMCAGGLIAIGLAQALSAAGDRVGSVVLLDPPPVPLPNPAFRDVDPTTDPRVYQTLYTNIEGQLQWWARQLEEVSVYVTDPIQRQRTAKVHIAMVLMFRRYIWPPFDGPTEFIISGERAGAHFHPQSPWRDLVAKPGRMHVIPGLHEDLFGRHRNDVLRLVRFAVDFALDS
ncbi:MAG TPA: alpha/beta fold hydrolase [Stellaceae bacterium]|nr:alpha/beta fold hydrolase [Stellaceae bacterium]